MYKIYKRTIIVQEDEGFGKKLIYVPQDQSYIHFKIYILVYIPQTILYK